MVAARSAVKKPARKWIAIAAVLGGLGVLAAVLWAAEAWARAQVADYVTEKVEQVLNLEPDQPVAVRIGGISVLAQLLGGTLEQIDVGVEDVRIGDLTGGVALTARGIPTDLTKPVESVQIEFSVSEETIQSAAHLLSASAIDEVDLVGSEIQFSSEFSLFGLPLEVGIGVEPFAADGEVGFTPTSVALNGARTSVADLTDRFGSFADALFTSRSICVARWLPVALSLTAVVVRDEELVITIGAEKRIFTEASLQKLGHCSSAAPD